jgi:predicted ester cyclase
MSLERNKELARAAIAIWSTGDLSRVLEVFAPGYVMHQHHHEAAGGAGDLDLKAMRDFAHEFHTGFPDFRDTIDLQLAEGDLVATRATSSGTHTGPFQGIAPTGKRLSWTGIAPTGKRLSWTGIVIDRVQDGRIVESWGNWDMMGLLQQLGVVPARPAPPKRSEDGAYEWT